MANPRLPQPTEKLAGCVWLPRFIAKVRLHEAGILDGDYQLAFCHSRGVDGRFLEHFNLDKDDAIRAILGSASDAECEQWFTSLPEVTSEHIDAWNEFAPLIGRPGHPGERELAFMLRRIYRGEPPPVALNSSFEAILWDESE